MRTLLAISNASAGTSSDDAVESALSILREEFDVQSAQTGSPEDLDEALAEHPAVDVVAALGGDGSLHAVVNALYRAERLADVAIALIPLGTGNDFARSLEVPTDPQEAARRVIASSGRTIDVIIADDDTAIVNAASVGLGAEAALRSKRYKEKWGPFGYVIGALKSLFIPDSAMTVHVDGKRVKRRSGRVTQVSVGNGRFVGGGAELFPIADLADGKMDVQVVYAPTLIGRALYVFHILTRSTHRAENIHYDTAEKVTVGGEELRTTIDGELGDPHPEYACRIEPGALTFLA